MSLQTGRPIGITDTPVIDPSDLKILAYHVDSPLIRSGDPDIIRLQEVREISPMGFIIDSIDDLTEADDVIKIRDILALNFHLIGHKVVTKQGKRVGKLVDYTVETGSFQIQQLIVRKSAVNPTELTIHRSKIVEIDDDKVVIDNDRETAPTPIHTSAHDPNFVNPFRKQHAHLQ